MKQLMLMGNLAWSIGCYEPCKNGYGRAADNLCYPLADDPVAPCGDGYARNDDGDCVAVATESGAGTTGGTSGASETGGSGGSGSPDGSETGPSDASGGDGTGAASAGGGPPGGSADAGSGTGSVDGFGAASIKGVLNTSDSSGFSEGDEVLIQVWTGDMIDPETGWPLESAMDSPRETHVAGAAVTAVSIHFEFTVSDVPDSGEEVRITGHLTEDSVDWEDAPQGAYPADPGAWLLLTPGMTTEDLALVIDNGGEGGDIPPPPDGGTPDMGPPDGGTPDMGPPDGGTPDGEAPDTGSPGVGL